MVPRPCILTMFADVRHSRTYCFSIVVCVFTVRSPLSYVVVDFSLTVVSLSVSPTPASAWQPTMAALNNPSTIKVIILFIQAPLQREPPPDSQNIGLSRTVCRRTDGLPRLFHSSQARAPNSIPSATNSVPDIHFQPGTAT